MLVPDYRGLLSLVMDLRRQVAQNTTDIQRLWRLTRRYQHQPQFVIGGDGGPYESSGDIGSFSDGTGSGPDSQGPGYPDDPPDSADSQGGGGGGTGGGGGGNPPGGGPNDSSAAGDDDCVWIWDGSAWVKVLDNTSGCECPEPGSPGSTIGETQITNCEDCFIDCHGCEIPCRITCTITGGSGEPLDDLVGSHTLNHNGSEWVSSCIGINAFGGLYNSAKIRVSCGGGSLLTLTIEIFASADCTTVQTTFGGTQTGFTCSPLNVDFTLSGGYTAEVTE